MRVEAAMLCNHAEVQNGMLYLHGGFPEFWSVPEIPVETSMPLAVVFEHELSETSVRFRVRFVCDETGDTVGGGDMDVPVTRKPGEFTAGAPAYLTFAVGLPVKFTHVGPHRVLVEDADSGEEMARIKFAVRVA